MSPSRSSIHFLASTPLPLLQTLHSVRFLSLEGHHAGPLGPGCTWEAGVPFSLLVPALEEGPSPLRVTPSSPASALLIQQ